MRILQDAGIATTFSQLRQIPHLPHPVQRIPFTVYRISYPPQPVLPLPVLCLMCYASTELYCILLCRFALCSGIWNFFPYLSTPHSSSLPLSLRPAYLCVPCGPGIPIRLPCLSCSLLLQYFHVVMHFTQVQHPNKHSKHRL